MSEAGAEVTVIVVNWNGARVLPRCLDALAAQTVRGFALMVVDNGSTDGSADGLEERWPGCRVHRLSSNQGFAAANNLAAREASTEWLALVNTDAFLAPDWLEVMLAAAEANPACVSFASRLLQADAPHLLDGAGDTYHVSGLAWRRRWGQPAESESGAPQEVFGPCAAAALYSRRAFLEAGGFDEDLVSYYEDVDLAFRLRLRGGRCLYVPGATALHVGSSSLGKLSSQAVYLTHRSLEWTYLKNMPGRVLLRSLPAHILMDMAYLVRYTFGGHARDIWMAKIDAARGLAAARRKRQQVQRSVINGGEAATEAIDYGWLSPYWPSVRIRLDRFRARKAGSRAEGQ